MWLHKLWERLASHGVCRAIVGQAGARVQHGQRAPARTGARRWLGIIAVAAIWPVYAKQVPVDEAGSPPQASSFGPHDTATAPLDLCRFVPQLKSSAVSLDGLKATLGVNGIDCGL